MNPLDYNLTRFYLKEISHLKKTGGHLGIILVGTLLVEFLIREEAKDYNTISMPFILDRLQKDGKIDKKQRELFDKIRGIRIKYIHLHANEEFYREITSFDMKTKSIVGENVFLNAKFNEADYNMFEGIFKRWWLKEDSRKIQEMLDKLIKGYYPEFIKKQA